jgi:hypothetical protein
MKDTAKGILAIVIGLLVLTGLGFYFGYAGNFFDATVTKQHMDIERNNFKHSKSYVEGKITDLGNYKREYERAKTAEEKQQIANFVSSEYANFDANLIQNSSLYSWLISIQNGEVSNQ